MEQIVLWQLILIFLGVCLAAAAAGSIIGYLVLRAQGKTWPFSWAFFTKRGGYPLIVARESPAVKGVERPPEQARQTRKRLDENVLRVTQDWKAAMEAKHPIRTGQADAEPAVQAQTSELLTEVGANLKIASSAREDNPIPFSTAAYDSKRGSLSSLPADIQERLTEAYTDIRLANTLIWIYKDKGRKNEEMTAGYVSLCTRIAGLLEQVMPGLRNSRI